MKARRRNNNLKFKLKSLLLIIMLAFCISTMGQITIDQSDMPVPGDTLRKSTALNSWQFDFNQTGSDFIWDFSALQPASQTVDTFVKVNEAPAVYWLWFLLSATMASPQGSSPIEQIPLTDIYNFYNNSNSSYADVGYAAMVYGLPLPFKFDQADIIFNFPTNYGNVDSSQSGFQLSVPDIAFLMVDRKRINTVDGWGNLTTPYGSFDVLRVKSEVTEYDSIYIDSLNIGVPINLEYTEYKWLAKGQKIPLLIATENLLGMVVSYRDSIRDLTVDIQEESILGNEHLLIYPNPVKSEMNVRYVIEETGDVELTIAGSDGRIYFSKKLENIQSGKHYYKIELSDTNLSYGSYFLLLKTSNTLKVSGFIYSP